MDGADVMPASSSSVSPSRSLLSGVDDDGPSCFFVFTGIKLMFILLNFFFVLMGVGGVVDDMLCGGRITFNYIGLV